MKTKRSLYVFAAVLAVVAIFGVWRAVSSGDEGDNRPTPGNGLETKVPGRGSSAGRKTGGQNNKKGQNNKNLKSRVSSVRSGRRLDEYSGMNPADRKIAIALQAALDDNDFASVAKMAQKALGSANPELRENAVDALGWFGAKALPELTPLMADSNEDVADSAMHHWQLGLSEIEDEGLKAQIAEKAMMSITRKDALEMIVTEITAQSDDLKIIKSLAGLIGCDNKAAVEVAKEEYESMTGEPWTGIDAAEKWLQENYEPDE